jgi:antitoxin component of MazEF toxin-antitoxin module
MKIAAWGNSLAIRIPKYVAEAAGWKAGAKVTVRNLDGGGVLIKPVDGAVAVAEDLSLVKVEASPPAPEQW